jgi:hypothetical protein
MQNRDGLKNQGTAETMLMNLMLMGILILAASPLFAAETPHKEKHVHNRVSVTLSGKNCPAHRQLIAQKLAEIPGVLRVNMELLEDHVLIDHVQDQRTAEDFKNIINGIIPQDGDCRAEIIEGCISAGPIPPTPPQ